MPITSVSSLEGLQYVETALDPVAYKIPSADVTDVELLKAVALTGKPIIISDGMTTPTQLGQALHVLGNQAILLRCVSEYPATPESYRLSVIKELAVGNAPIGISDHTTDYAIAVAAAALGAQVIEKHLMLQDYETEPLDVGHSVTPRKFARMVRHVRAVERSLAALPSLGVEDGVGTGFRRRIVFIADLPKGTQIRPEHIRTARCGEGLELEEAPRVFGRAVVGDVRYGDPVTEDILR